MGEEIGVKGNTITRCSAFIATSVDGYIATPEGSVAWLDKAGVTPPEGTNDDGGSIITQCLALGFMDKLCITQAPVLLGEGIPLFGHLPASISLTYVAAELLPNNFLQVTYRVTPSPETP